MKEPTFSLNRRRRERKSEIIQRDRRCERKNGTSGKEGKRRGRRVDGGREGGEKNEGREREGNR